MKCFITISSIFLLSLIGPQTDQILAQNLHPHYWIAFTDKQNNSYSLDRPEEFLSERALHRRSAQGITITEQDLPVSETYLGQIRAAGAEVINVSKWFNGAIIATADSTVVESLELLEFVSGPPLLLRPSFQFKSGYHSNKMDFPVAGHNEVYEYGQNQVGMISLDDLHEQGYLGSGMLIAVLDAGFTNANEISSLQHLWEEQRILAVRDVVQDGRDFFNTHAHGTVVLSILAGVKPGILRGTAPASEYLLIRTEDASTEFLIEEYNWVVGAELADSLGADLINSSLGYSVFNDPSQNHSFEDMDGMTTPVTLAAEIAATKGIAVITSAGNSGGPPWFKITAPADGEQIMAIGAVDSTGMITPFSSRGPTADGRIKPDVVAMGLYTVAQHPEGYFYYCAGTSCSAPVITGAAACLWEKHRNVSAPQIRSAIRNSGDRYLSPDTLYGYGIPNFNLASRVLEFDDEGSRKPHLKAFPNPFSDIIYIELSLDSPGKITLEIFDLQGSRILMEEYQAGQPYLIVNPGWASALRSGTYILRVTSAQGSREFVVTKIKSGT